MKVMEGLRAGEVVGEGRVEEGGGVRGSEASTVDAVLYARRPGSCLCSY